MGFLDEIKNKLPFGQAGAYDQDDYGAEEGYDDAYYDDAPEGGYPDDSYGAGAYGTSDGYGYDDEPSNGVLGQTRRGEAESVAVYTRSGQLVGDADRHATTYNPPARSQDAVAYRPGAYDTPSSYASGMHAAPAAPAPTPSVSTTADRVAAVINGTPQLPAYVLRPESYDDVETVVRRVRTKQPVALVFVRRLPSACLISPMVLRAAWALPCARWATACSWCCPRAVRSRIPIFPSCAPTAILRAR